MLTFSLLQFLTRFRRIVFLQKATTFFFISKKKNTESIRMKRKFKSEVFPLLFFLTFQTKVSFGVGGDVPEYIQNFGNFSDQLVHILEVSEPTEHRPGVHLYTPFSVGYLMANIYESLWPVPVREIPEAIFTLKRYVATDYAALLRLFKKRQFRISSTIYSSFGNVTKPQSFPQLLTQVISLDLQKNRTDFRRSLREIVERGTKGHLDNELLPKKDPAWREIFDNTTHGVYVNTLHYKANWDKPWKLIGDRKFFDKAHVPFIELQGEYLFAENENASAVIINLQASTKQVILFKPHDFSSITDMRRIVRKMLNDESLWKMENITIQMPALNVTNLSQPSDKFPFLGVMDTFCRGRYMDPSQFYYNQHPIAHANHFEFSPNFLEISSTSGSLVAYQNNKDFLPKPPANQSHHHESSTTNDVDYFDILEASEEEDQQFLDYIVDARSDIPSQKRFRGEFHPNFFKRRNNRKNMNNKNNSVPPPPTSEFEECEPILPIPQEESEPNLSPDDENFPATTTVPQGNNASNINVEEQESTPPVTTTSTSSASLSSSTKQTLSPDPTQSKNRTFVLDKPYSWILRDKEIGIVFYGSVSSLCLYNRAVHHIPTVPVWVLDLFKAFYWRCV